MRVQGRLACALPLVAAVAAAAVTAGMLWSLATSFLHVTVLADVHDTAPPPAARARGLLLIVVDGLRHDTALGRSPLAITKELALRCASGVAVASEPTMTGAGVRTIGTGVPPELADVFRNDDMPAVRFEHLFSALRGAGHRIGFIGSHVWVDLFGDSFAFAHTSRELPRLRGAIDPIHVPDRAYVEWARRAVVEQQATVVVVHLVGIDYASHTWGPHTARFRERLRELDQQLRTLVQAAPADWLVLITSDHGATDRGHHGSGERLARNSPLVLCGPGVAHVGHVEARHIDLAPTLAALLGVPAPAAAEGRVLIELLDASPRERAELALANARRLERYVAAYGQRVDGEVALDGAPLAEAAHLLAGGDAEAAAMLADRQARRAHDVLSASRARRTLAPAVWLPVLLVLGGALPLLLPGRRRGDRRIAAVVLVTLAGWELLLASWRVNAGPLGRELSRASYRLGLDRHWPTLIAVAVALAIISALVAVVARHRRDAWVCFAVIMVMASLAGGAALAVALAALLVAGMWSSRRGESLALLAAGAMSLVAATGPLGLERVAWTAGLLAGLGLVLAGLWHAQVTRAAGAADRLAVHLLLLLLVLAVAQSLLGAPWWMARGFAALVLAGVLALAVAPLSPALARTAPAWACAALTAAMSTPSQLVGVTGVTVGAALIGRLPVLAEDRPEAELAAAALAIALRYAFFAVLEGEFSLSHLEWSVAVYGNPAQDAFAGGLIVFGKFVLPMIVCFGLVAAHLHPARLRATFYLAIAFLLLRLAHILASLLLTRGQYYTPHGDLAELIFIAGFVAALPLAAAAIRGRCAAGPAVSSRSR